MRIEWFWVRVDLPFNNPPRLPGRYRYPFLCFKFLAWAHMWFSCRDSQLDVVCCSCRIPTGESSNRQTAFGLAGPGFTAAFSLLMLEMDGQMAKWFVP